MHAVSATVWAAKAKALPLDKSAATALSARDTTLTLMPAGALLLGPLTASITRSFTANTSWPVAYLTFACCHLTCSFCSLLPFLDLNASQTPSVCLQGISTFIPFQMKGKDCMYVHLKLVHILHVREVVAVESVKASLTGLKHDLGAVNFVPSINIPQHLADYVNLISQLNSTFRNSQRYYLQRRPVCGEAALQRSCRVAFSDQLCKVGRLLPCKPQIGRS